MDLEVFLRINMNMTKGDLVHAWALSGRCSAPPYLVIMNLINPWYIWPSGHGSLSVCVSCSLRVESYLGRKDVISLELLIQVRQQPIPFIKKSICS